MTWSVTLNIQLEESYDSKECGKRPVSCSGFEITCHRSNLKYEMPKLWENLNRRIGEIKNRVPNGYRLDIALGKNHEDYTQCVCVEVHELDEVPVGMKGYTIPKREYIVYPHKGSDVGKSYFEVITWLQNNGYKKDPADFR